MLTALLGSRSRKRLITLERETFETEIRSAWEEEHVSSLQSPLVSSSLVPRLFITCHSGHQLDCHAREDCKRRNEPRG